MVSLFSDHSCSPRSVADPQVAAELERKDKGGMPGSPRLQRTVVSSARPQHALGPQH